MRAEDIEQMIISKTHLLVINSLQNSTDAIADPAALKDIYKLAEKYDLYIFSNDIYSGMNYSADPFLALASKDSCNERVILTGGFSKTFPMTGWRLGMVVAPSVVAERMMMLL